MEQTTHTTMKHTAKVNLSMFTQLVQQNTSWFLTNCGNFNIAVITQRLASSLQLFEGSFGKLESILDKNGTFANLSREPVCEEAAGILVEALRNLYDATSRTPQVDNLFQNILQTQTRLLHYIMVVCRYMNGSNIFSVEFVKCCAESGVYLYQFSTHDTCTISPKQAGWSAENMRQGFEKLALIVLDLMKLCSISNTGIFPMRNSDAAGPSVHGRNQSVIKMHLIPAFIARASILCNQHHDSVHANQTCSVSQFINHHKHVVSDLLDTFAHIKAMVSNAADITTITNMIVEFLLVQVVGCVSRKANDAALFCYNTATQLGGYNPWPSDPGTKSTISLPHPTTGMIWIANARLVDDPLVSIERLNTVSQCLLMDQTKEIRLKRIRCLLELGILYNKFGNGMDKTSDSHHKDVLSQYIRMLRLIDEMDLLQPCCSSHLEAGPWTLHARGVVRSILIEMCCDSTISEQLACRMFDALSKLISRQLPQIEVMRVYWEVLVCRGKMLHGALATDIATALLDKSVRGDSIEFPHRYSVEQYRGALSALIYSLSAKNPRCCVILIAASHMRGPDPAIDSDEERATSAARELLQSCQLNLQMGNPKQAYTDVSKALAVFRRFPHLNPTTGSNVSCVLKGLHLRLLATMKTWHQSQHVVECSVVDQLHQISHHPDFTMTDSHVKLLCMSLTAIDTYAPEQCLPNALSLIWRARISARTGCGPLNCYKLDRVLDLHEVTVLTKLATIKLQKMIAPNFDQIVRTLVRATTAVVPNVENASINSYDLEYVCSLLHSLAGTCRNVFNIVQRSTSVIGTNSSYKKLWILVAQEHAITILLCETDLHACILQLLPGTKLLKWHGGVQQNLCNTIVLACHTFLQVVVKTETTGRDTLTIYSKYFDVIYEKLNQLEAVVQGRQDMHWESSERIDKELWRSLVLLQVLTCVCNEMHNTPVAHTCTLNENGEYDKYVVSYLGMYGYCLDQHAIAAHLFLKHSRYSTAASLLRLIVESMLVSTVNCQQAGLSKSETNRIIQFLDAVSTRATNEVNEFETLYKCFASPLATSKELLSNHPKVNENSLARNSYERCILDKLSAVHNVLEETKIETSRTVEIAP